MYEFIEGKLDELTPAYAVIQVGGVGYLIQLSLHSYSRLNNLPYKENCRIFIHQVIREDAHILFGFSSKKEREIFRLLITVSGVGANTARMMLSSMTPEEIQKAIAEANDNALKSIKGIGLKTAQRIIIDLKDKIGIDFTGEEKFLLKDNRIKDEALTALVTLGFPKSAVLKLLDKILATNAPQSVEELIKYALKNL
jgi:holliday junction DNA helicase RuvA